MIYKNIYKLFIIPIINQNFLQIAFIKWEQIFRVLGTYTNNDYRNVMKSVKITSKPKTKN